MGACVLIEDEGKRWTQKQKCPFWTKNSVGGKKRIGGKEEKQNGLRTMKRAETGDARVVM